MNIGEETLELIDRYLSDALTESEKESFNLRLTEDFEFKALVENQKFANELILGDRLYSLKSMMDEDFSSGKIKSGQNSLNSGRLYLFGGMALVASALLVYLMFGNTDVEQKNAVVDSGKIEANQNPNIKSAGTNPEEITFSVKNRKLKRKNKNTDEIVQLPEGEPSAVVGILDALNDSGNESATVVKDQQHTTQSLPQIVEIRCAVKMIQAKVKSEPSCTDKEDGRLIVVKIPDHVSPIAYGIAIAAGDTLWQSSNIFSNLSSGNYAVCVKDANGCRMQVKDLVEIGSKECKKTQQAYSFNPAYGETISIKVENAGTLTIRNRAGIVVFSAGVSSGDDFNWDGQTTSGGISTPGLYIYSLEYNNGNSVRGEILIY